MEEIIEAYLKGSLSVEVEVIASLRRLGEGYARRRGFKGFDVDAAGVDFAAYMLTEGLPGLQRFEGTKEAYLKRAARWFIANLARSLASGGTGNDGGGDPRPVGGVAPVLSS